MVKVFLFHRVSPDKDRLWSPITPANFENIIKYINKSYHIVNVDQISTLGSMDKSRTPALITFDDGYKDFIDYALPIMDKYKVPSSCFIITDCTNNSMPPWTYVLDYAFQHSQRYELSMDKDLLPDNLKRTKWNGVDERLSYAKRLKLFLKKQTHRDRTKILDGVLQGLDDIHIPDDLLMTWDDIVEIKNQGVQIGSHTHTHPLLDKIEDMEELKKELSLSKQILEEKLAQKIDYISYPNGNYDLRTIEIARTLGYKVGFAVKEKSYLPHSDAIFEIPRISLFDEGVLKTKLRANGIMQTVKSFLGR